MTKRLKITSGPKNHTSVPFFDPWPLRLHCSWYHFDFKPALRPRWQAPPSAKLMVKGTGSVCDDHHTEILWIQPLSLSAHVPWWRKAWWNMDFLKFWVATGGSLRKQCENMVSPEETTKFHTFAWLQDQNLSCASAMLQVLAHGGPLLSRVFESSLVWLVEPGQGFFTFPGFVAPAQMDCHVLALLQAFFQHETTWPKVDFKTGQRQTWNICDFNPRTKLTAWILKGRFCSRVRTNFVCHPTLKSDKLNLIIMKITLVYIFWPISKDFKTSRHIQKNLRYGCLLCPNNSRHIKTYQDQRVPDLNQGAILIARKDHHFFRIVFSFTSILA